MGLTDLRIIAARPQQANTLPSCDERFERYAYLDPRTRETVVRRLADGVELLRLPRPDVMCWYANVNFSPDGELLRVRYAVQDELGVTEIWNLAHRERIFREETRSQMLLVPPQRPRLLLRAGGDGPGGLGP